MAQFDLFDHVPDLAHDIGEPDYISIGHVDDGGDWSTSVRQTMWFGPSGTQSPLHTDPDDNFLCQIVGTKYVRLYHPDHGHALHANGTNTSQIDLANIGRRQQSDHDDDAIRTLPFVDGTLSSGDMLFIPQSMWHYVESLSVSISVNFWWRYHPNDRISTNRFMTCQ